VETDRQVLAVLVVLLVVAPRGCTLQAAVVVGEPLVVQPITLLVARLVVVLPLTVILQPLQ
jgi:hypothetical protein